MPLHVSSTVCSSSGGQNCIIQHLVLSHYSSVGGRPVRRLREDSVHRKAPTECDDSKSCVKLNTTNQSITQHLFYIQCYICQGDMFGPIRSSSGPPRKPDPNIGSGFLGGIAHLGSQMFHIVIHLGS